MQLLSQIGRKYKNKEYEKCWVVIPTKTIKELGWKKGDILEHKIATKRIIIKRKRKRNDNN